MRTESVVKLVKKMEAAAAASRTRTREGDLHGVEEAYEFGFRAGLQQAMAYLIDAQDEAV